MECQSKNGNEPVRACVYLCENESEGERDEVKHKRGEKMFLNALR